MFALPFVVFLITGKQFFDAKNPAPMANKILSVVILILIGIAAYLWFAPPKNPCRQSAGYPSLPR